MNFKENCLLYEYFRNQYFCDPWIVCTVSIHLDPLKYSLLY